MAHSIPRQTKTQADDLRALLARSYTTAVSINGVGAERARGLLEDMDRIQALLPQLEAQGADLRAERGRWQEVQGAVRRHDSALRSELAPLGGLKTLRKALPQPPSPEERWWWWLDVTARKNIRRRVLVTLAVVAGILALLIGGVWTFNKLFPVDPAVSAAYGHKNKAEDLVLEGKLSEALTELEAAYEFTPDDTDILTMMAALYDLTDQEEKAAPILRKLYEDYPPSLVNSNIAQAYVAAGDAEKARVLALQAIEDDPANPQGYLIAGMVYESEGDVRTAMDYYQKAADAASAAKDYQTEAFAKMRLATLLQQPHPPAKVTSQPGD